MININYRKLLDRHCRLETQNVYFLAHICKQVKKEDMIKIMCKYNCIMLCEHLVKCNAYMENDKVFLFKKSCNLNNSEIARIFRCDNIPCTTFLSEINISFKYHHYDMIKMFISIYPMISIECKFIRACKDGDLKLCKWIHENYKLCNREKYFEVACSNNHIKICKWLIGKYQYMYIDFDYIIMELCENGYINMFKWLLNVQCIGIDINTSEDYCFYAACTNGHLDFAKFLLKINDEINIHVDNDIVCHETCANGHIDIVLWLLTLDTFNYNLSFCYCADNNNMIMCKWLYNNFEIDINYDNDHAFAKAGQNGHIDMCKWLLSLPNNNINIRTNNEHPFRMACKNGHIDMCEYLKTVNSDYSYKYVNDKLVPIIKSLFNDEMCTICYHNCDIITNCGHHYCEKCINQWLKTNNSCPMCRGNINYFVYKN